jgi:pimeloyl-ACP methyl ester carboxylesterase
MIASDDIDHNRRQLLATAAVTIAAAQLGMASAAEAQSNKTKLAQASIKPGAHTSFSSLKQTDAGVLNVGYAEAGPANGPPVILLHGWPYDIYSFVDVTPALASAGYRVIVPYVRGYGSTKFLSSDAPRNGQPSAVAADVVALMDALKIEKATLAGFDWGARSANIVAALWPERCKAMVSVSGYLIGSQEAGKIPLPPSAELHGGTSFTSPLNAAGPVMTSTGASSRSSSGSLRRRSGNSTTPRSIAAPRRSTIRITWQSSSTITAGASDSPKAKRSTTRLRKSSRQPRSLQCRPSRSRAMPTARRIPSRQPTPRCSRVNISTAPSRAA